MTKTYLAFLGGCLAEERAEWEDHMEMRNGRAQVLPPGAPGLASRPKRAATRVEVLERFPSAGATAVKFSPQTGQHPPQLPLHYADFCCAYPHNIHRFFWVSSLALFSQVQRKRFELAHFYRIDKLGKSEPV